MKKLAYLSTVVAAGWFLWNRLQPLETKPGACLESGPSQDFTLAVPIKRDGFTIYPVAGFQVDALVLGKKEYNDGDHESRLSPLDLALGWGPMADEGAAAQLAATQGGRAYHWRNQRLPMPVEDVIRNTANMHIIPGTPEVLRFLDTVGPGQRISLKGKLVNVRGPERWGWRSSQSRVDTGDGSCEILYVDRAVRIGAPALEEPPATEAAPKPVKPVVGRPPAKPPTTERTVRLRKTTTFPIRYGSLTVPAGDDVRIAAEKGSKVKAVYRGIEFWVERNALE